MEDRRKYKRLPIEMELTVSSLFQQDFQTIEGLNENIEVVDISKSGIGFMCKYELPMNFYFDTKVVLTPEKYFYCVLKIVRVKKLEEGYFLGAEFVGLADILSHVIDEYEQELDRE